ncbi:SAM-dependent methyltransferase [Saccharopolyspora spinosa]
MYDDLVSARRARMRWNTPLSVAHADLLLDRLNVGPVTWIVDMGCGWGELLLRAVERAVGSNPVVDDRDSRARGVGVDTDPVALERGRALARRRGLEGRVEFVHADAATWSGAAERALCVGSSHAFGGSRAALEALAALVPHAGRLLFGDGCWPGSTTPGCHGHLR